MYINLSSDTILINLRDNNNDNYKIPYGGFFKYVSCPNYFGEILEWLGFAILTWSLSGLAFMLWTCFNLIQELLNIIIGTMKILKNTQKIERLYFPTYYNE